MPFVGGTKSNSNWIAASDSVQSTHLYQESIRRAFPFRPGGSQVRVITGVFELAGQVATRRVPVRFAAPGRRDGRAGMLRGR
jgi:hypothetical protein